MTIRMGYWDCPSCGTTKIEGPNRNCPNCGTPREEDVQFYTEDDAPEVKDAALLKRAAAGGDWTCEYCSTENPATKTDCAGCGAPRDGAAGRKAKVVGEAKGAGAPKPKPQPVKLGAPHILGCLAVVALLVAGVWFMFFKTTNVGVEVVSKSWVKSIQVMNAKWVDKQGFADEVPRENGTTVKYTRRTTKERTIEVQDGTKEVKTGKKIDLGNGMFKDEVKTVPNMVKKKVNEPFIHYRELTWVQGQKLTESKDDGSEPPWPSFTAQKDKTKAGTRSNQIVFKLRDPKTKKEYTYTLNADDTKERALADKFKVGQSYVAKITTAGSVTELVPAGAAAQ